jgi:hypothetical protein
MWSPNPRPSINEQGKCLRETKTLEHVQICIANLLRRYSKEWCIAKVIVGAIHHHFCIITVPVDELSKKNCSSNNFELNVLPKKHKHDETKQLCLHASNFKLIKRHIGSGKLAVAEWPRCALLAGRRLARPVRVRCSTRFPTGRRDARAEEQVLKVEQPQPCATSGGQT